MKIQVASDLHLEFYKDQWDIFGKDLFKPLLIPVPDVNLLILAGDIGYPEDQITNAFIKWCCDIWPHVVWIMGNHEYYTFSENKYTMNEKEMLAEDYMYIYKNLAVLNSYMDDTYESEGFRILGTTLWTDFERSQVHVLKKLNDFRNIRVERSVPFTPSHWLDLHKKSREFLQEQLDECFAKGFKAIVITHHLPTYMMIPDEYKGSDLNCGFAAHADDLLGHPATALWICGHSHGKRSSLIKKRTGEYIQCVLNARGYPNEKTTTTYNPEKYIYI